MAGLVLALMAVLGGCEVINPDEKLPAYIQVGEPRLVQPSGDTVMAGVPDVWVFQGNNYWGTFEPPLVFPVTNLEEGRFFFIPGVWRDAFSAEREQFAYVTADSAVWDLTPRDTFRIDPIYEYRPVDTVIEFHFEETFEGLGVSFEDIPRVANDVQMQRSTNNPLSGDQCGVIEFGPDDSLMNLRNDQPLFLPRSGEVWLEVSHRGNRNFAVTLQGFEGGGSDPLTIYSPRVPIIPEAPPTMDEWRTHYFYLTPYIAATNPSFANYLVLSSGAPDSANYRMYFDNIRIMSFK
jgi:hypothetical protein